MLAQPLPEESPTLSPPAPTLATSPLALPLHSPPGEKNRGGTSGIGLHRQSPPGGSEEPEGVEPLDIWAGGGGCDANSTRDCQAHRSLGLRRWEGSQGSLSGRGLVTGDTAPGDVVVLGPSVSKRRSGTNEFQLALAALPRSLYKAGKHLRGIRMKLHKE